MQNSSRQTNIILRKPTSIKDKYSTFLLLLFLIITLLNTDVFGQIELENPKEFQSLSINTRALEKNIELTIDENTNNITQNIALDKTGFILHLVPSPKIKDEKTKLKIISSQGEEITTYKFTDQNIFALVDPEKTYSIVQEIKPDCKELSTLFGSTDLICPDNEAFKIIENIMLISDTSIKVKLKKPIEFYKIPVSINENNDQHGLINLVEILKPNEETQNETPLLNTEQILPSAIGLQNIIGTSNLCIIGSLGMVAANDTIKCNFYNENIKSVIKFKNNLTSNLISNNNLNLVISLLFNHFRNLELTFVLSTNNEVKSQNNAIEISNTSKEKFLLDNHKYELNLVYGKLDKVKERIGKNIYNLKNTFIINKTLGKIKFLVPFSNLEAIVKPNKDIESFFTNLSIEGKNKNNKNDFNLSINNNILIKNLIEPTPSPRPTPSSLLTKSSNEVYGETNQDLDKQNLEITTFLPIDNYNITLNRKFTFVEVTKGPSVDEKGKPVEVINNKSRGDLILTDKFDDINITNNTTNLTLEIEKASKIFEDKIFKKWLGVSGFLIPPDFRPVLEEGYRATIEVSMIINLKDESSLQINYSDIKTKDEPPLANFFKFSYLLPGTYEANIRFDSDREKLFELAGIVAKPNEIK